MCKSVSDTNERVMALPINKHVAWKGDRHNYQVQRYVETSHFHSGVTWEAQLLVLLIMPICLENFGLL